MAINKSKTSPAMKAVLVLLIVAFVASFVSIGAGLFSGGGGGTTTSTQQQNDPLAAANAQYQPTVSALTGQLQSQPESYTALVSLANTYFDWAAAVQQASQTSTSAVGADLPLWTGAKDAYKRAIVVKKGEPAVSTDYAITLFYTGDTTGAIKVATEVTKTNPEFASAYFNLGIFNGTLGENAKAAAAFKKAIALDPQGKSVNLEYAKQQLASLESSATSGTP